MNPDRSFCCSNCSKTFKLSWHLKNHEKTCKGKKIYAAECKLCDKKFTTKFSFTRHKETCSVKEGYKCSHCKETFNTRHEHYVHMKKKHNKTQCSICDNFVHNQNKKRHMENNHKGETPSITKWKNDQKQKKEGKTNKYSCLECRKYFFDKSNTNRHMKKHNYKCHICEKSFFNENDLKSHLQVHQDEIKHAKPNIVTNISKQKKIKWRKNISCIKIFLSLKLQ